MGVTPYAYDSDVVAGPNTRGSFVFDTGDLADDRHGYVNANNVETNDLTEAVGFVVKGLDLDEVLVSRVSVYGEPQWFRWCFISRRNPARGRLDGGPRQRQKL